MKKRPQKFRVLVTAGPTREHIDPVRYLSNDSSGQMGFALAAAAREFGCDVTLVAGPVALATPPGVRRIDVVTARQMRREVMRLAAKANVVIMAAAVADWRPAHTLKRKWKRRGTMSYVSTLVRSYVSKTTKGLRKYQRTNVPTYQPTITLVENPDILAELGKKKKPLQTLVGFALETDHLGRNAREKLERKNCDWIVANSATAIGARKSRAILLNANGQRIPLPRLPKQDLAVVILSHILG